MPHQASSIYHPPVDFLHPVDFGAESPRSLHYPHVRSYRGAIGSRQVQASSSLFWEVLRKYDPANRLLAQAEAELLAQELEIGRLAASLARMAGQRLVLQPLARPSPFAFPLMVERFREKLSNESVAARIARMVARTFCMVASDSSDALRAP